MTGVAQVVPASTTPGQRTIQADARRGAGQKRRAYPLEVGLHVQHEIQPAAADVTLDPPQVGQALARNRQGLRGLEGPGLTYHRDGGAQLGVVAQPARGSQGALSAGHGGGGRSELGRSLEGRVDRVTAGGADTGPSENEAA